MRISYSSLYWPRRFPLPLWVTCWRPGVCQEECGLHLTALRAPDWLPFRLLSQKFSLCEYSTAAQRAESVTRVPGALLPSLGLLNGSVPVTVIPMEKKGE